ncbi:hypothetical protein F5887DRAFT_874082 [Amanita rubescens]|nr:hypothetical protein F5887DRAFT_874082 [Amanita rubescens]
MLRERYRCPQFRILVIGRALAGKTTILEKVCGVEKGTLPIISDENGKQLMICGCLNVTNSQRGIHNIEHQITYQGSNFIFHDSPGFEAGSHDEINEVWKFIKRRSNSIELKDQLHAIWYCIPMDSPRPLLSTELEFFNRGTGKVPLVVAFTKFDGQIINEYVNLGDELSNEARWEKARENADKTFQTVYLHKVLNTRFPPKEYVRLEDMDVIENTCSELVEKTADIIDDASLHQLLVSTQMNNLDLCVKAAIK